MWDGPPVRMLRNPGNPGNIERRLVAASRKEKAKVQSSVFSSGCCFSSAGPPGRAKAPGPSFCVGGGRNPGVALSPSFLSSLSSSSSPLSVGSWRQAAPSPPHTTVLTDGSDKLSWPVMSVGGYCCRGGERQGGEGRGAEFGEGDTTGSHVWRRAALGFSLSHLSL